jgi:hypothetical protein
MGSCVPALGQSRAPGLWSASSVALSLFPACPLCPLSPQGLYTPPLSFSYVAWHSD